jgi:parvulin-like peptidyl-prolyl isomerase
MKQYSEDPASKDTGLAYEIRTETEYWPEFKQLALHLKQNEAGIVKTQWGYHVVERVAPPPPDPFESTEILARPAVPGLALVQQVMIGWKDAPGAQRLMNAPKRSKAEADQIARDVLERARAGEDFASLMKYTDELESMKLARTYEVNTADDPVPFAKLAVRMKVGEVGVVKSLFGWHIVKRIPPPPGDKLDSAAILKRDTVADKVKVKHIVLGWTDAHGKDPRGKTRDRSTLEKLVSTTLARLKKGESFESLMKELSEDPKSATTGESFEVTPTATTLLLPFRNLALRLHPGEVGVVKSQIGIHIVERVE